MSFRGMPNAENGINKHYGGYKTMIINVYSIKKAERKDGTPIFIVNVKSTLLDSVQAFKSLEIAKFHLETVTKRLQKYNITLTENNRIRTPKNCLNAYINDDRARIFDSIEEYKNRYTALGYTF